MSLLLMGKSFRQSSSASSRWSMIFGTPSEAAGKVRKVVEEVEKKFDQAAGFFTGCIDR